MLWDFLNFIVGKIVFFCSSIGGDCFPKPLSPEDEAKYLTAFREKGDQKAKEMLIKHNLRLVAHIAKKYENSTVDKDDLLSIGSFGLIKAIDSFNFKQGVRLATYAARCIENEILMHLRSNKKYKDTSSLYAPIGEDKEGNEIRLCDIIEDPSPSITDAIILEEHNKNLNAALSILNDRELDIISRRFGLNDYFIETQKEIAKSLKISRSYVSRIEKRALTKLYLYLKEK